MSDLSTGGPTADLPEGWKEPWGYPANKSMLWVGKGAATPDDINRLTDAGFTEYEENTLVGTEDIRWDAPQFLAHKLVIDTLAPCETLPRPGGDGSWAYKSQHLPDIVSKVMCERKWMLNLDGKMVRSKGGEAVKKIDLGDGVWEYHQVNVQVTWDDTLRLWRLCS